MLVRQKTGSGETATPVTAIEFTDPGAADMDIPGTDPVRYSIEIWLRLYQQTETLTYSLTCYSTGTMPSGVTIYARTETSYSTPVVPTSVTGMVDFTTYTSGSKLALDSGDSNTSTGDVGKYLVLVCELAKGTSAGVKIGEDIVFGWEAI